MDVTNIRRVICRSTTALIKSPVFTESLVAPHYGKISIIYLNRPSVHNAISVDFLSCLKREIKIILEEKDREKSTRAVIIASNTNKHFCVGADLKERRGFTTEQTRKFLKTLRGTFNMLSSSSIPTISAIHGLALGGGLELALCTHFRVMASTSFLGLPETRLGIIPGAGGTIRLPLLIGKSRAADLILTGRQVGAEEALRIGLCDRVVDIEPEGVETDGSHSKAKESVLAAAVEMATEICKGGPLAVNQALHAVKTGEENEAYEAVLQSWDRTEALEAFAEKRVPNFRGE